MMQGEQCLKMCREAGAFRCMLGGSCGWSENLGRTEDGLGELFVAVTGGRRSGEGSEGRVRGGCTAQISIRSSLILPWHTICFCPSHRF